MIRVIPFMKSAIFPTRLAALSLALCAATPSHAQTQLNEVVVTATRFSETASAVPYAVSVVTQDEIRASGATTVNEALIKLLGIPGRLDTSGGGNYTLDLRGFGGTADKNQVVIVDGRRLKEDDLSASDLSVVPIETVERIEVIRGSGSVQYGEGATGGVIVVTTKAGKGVARHNAATVGASFGSFATREAHASAVLASGGFSVDVAAKDERSNGHRDNFASTANSLASTVQWSNDWLRVGAQSGRRIVQSGWPGALTTAQYANDPAQAASLVDNGTSKRENTGVFGEAMLGDWQLAADANERTRQVRNFSGAAYGSDVIASNANLRARYLTRGDAVTNALVLGIDNSKWASTTTVGWGAGAITDSRSTAVYATDDVTWVATGTRLNVGVRGDSVAKQTTTSAVRLDERPTAWQLGVSQALTPTVTAYGHLGSGYRLATGDEYTFTQPGVVLQTQTSRDSELGARWVQGADRLELRWYRSDLTNELGYDPVIANPGSWTGMGANVNLDPTRRQGVELEAKHQLVQTLQLRANLAVREAKFSAGPYSGNDIALVPHQTAALGATWRPMAGHLLDGGINWVSEQSATFSNQCNVPSYTTLDARYAYTMGKLELALGVKNLADTKYYTLAYGCAAGVPTSIYPEPGRSVTASAQFSF